MNTIIKITDDFSLEKITNSGQCFRVHKFSNEVFRFITTTNILYINSLGNQQYQVSCSVEEWNNVWFDYFDLSRNYQQVRSSIQQDDQFLVNAAEFGNGIRILHQDPWETLITFIISQRKSILAIKECVQLLSEKYGTPTRTQYENIFTFPTASQMKHATESELLECKLGYRAKYIYEAIESINSQKVNLLDLYQSKNIDLLNTFTSMYGVGNKIANCVGLFAYGRVSLSPIDTWIKKIIDTVYAGKNPFEDYSDMAGIIQQYMFYYVQNHKEMF